MELNTLEGDNKILLSNNEEDKSNIISKEDNINQDFNNQEIKSHKSKLSKERQEVTSSANGTKNAKDIPSKESTIKRKIYSKRVLEKNIQKKKKNANPFLTETNCLEYSSQRRSSKLETNRNTGKMSYLNKFKNDKSEISEIKDSNVNQTVFSKISENMYKNSKEETHPFKKPHNLELEGEDQYNKLTEEAFLCSCANRANKENKKIIYEFLGRKKIEEISKKIGIDSEKEKENELETFQDIKRLTVITDRNRSYVSSRTFQEFLQDQKEKEEKHQNHLKINETLKKEEINSTLKDRPALNEETIKLAKNNIRKTNANIHTRLYNEYNDKKKKNEEKEIEKNKMFNKKDVKKLSKVKIFENVERLFQEYKKKNKRYDENESKKENELRNLSSNHSMSKNSNEILFKRFKKNLENSLENLLEKKIDEDFEINFNDFVKLLYKINFTTKNYYELMENKKNNNDKEKNEENIKIINNSNKSNRLIYKKINYEYDKEYKLIIDAWKIITKNKEFKSDMQGSSKRLLLFFLSVLGIYNGNIEDHFIKKEFPFIIESIKKNNGSPINYSNLSKQINKYFNLYRSNAINSLLFREKEIKRRLDLESEFEKRLPFTPSLEKSSRDFLTINNSVTEKRLSVEKHYDQYRKNKELKIKEKEKLLEKEEKEKCPFVPCKSKNKEKKNIIEITERLHKTGLKHLKISNSSPNNFLIEDKNRKSYLMEKTFNPNNNSIKKMFDNNPLEKDSKVKKKIKDLKESRNKKSFEKLILKKGFKPKENFKNNSSLYEINEQSFKNGRFAHDDEPLNNFKNTFQKYERFDKRNPKKGKYVFEIIVNNKPKNLIIYPDEDINYKIKVFGDVYKLNHNDKKIILQTIQKQLKQKI